VLPVPTPPSGAPCTVTKAAKHVMTMRSRSRRQGARLTEFFIDGVVVFVGFIFCLRGLLTALTAIQFRPEPRTMLKRRIQEATHFG